MSRTGQTGSAVVVVDGAPDIVVSPGKTKPLTKPMETIVEKAVAETTTVEEKKAFDDSTHGYLITYDDHGDINNMLLALFLYFIQMFLYSLLWSEAMTLISDDHVEVKITWNACDEANERPTAANLECEANDETVWYHTVLPYVLLSMYIQPDIVSCFGIIFSKKSCFKRLMALVILSEGGFALLTGLLWSFQGIYKGSGYDAIVNSIGVLFIHDLDEQLFKSVEKMNSSRLKSCCARCCKCFTCCHNFCSLLCTLLFVIVVAIMGFCVSEVAWANTDWEDGEWVGEGVADSTFSTTASGSFITTASSTAGSYYDYGS